MKRAVEKRSTAPRTTRRVAPTPATPPPSAREERAIYQALTILEGRLRKPGAQMSNPATVRAFLRLRLAGLESEHFEGLFLDSQHRLIAAETLSRGTIDAAAVYPREIVKRAMTLNAAAVILAHNHPSGIAAPSEADRLITQRLKQALALVDVRVLDHFVIGAGDPFSFAEGGLL